MKGAFVICENLFVILVKLRLAFIKLTFILDIWKLQKNEVFSSKKNSV